jgi:hypothetical protein
MGIELVLEMVNKFNIEWQIQHKISDLLLTYLNTTKY